MPNYNAQINSIKNGKYFGGLGPVEAGKLGGRKKAKRSKKDEELD